MVFQIKLFWFIKLSSASIISSVPALIYSFIFSLLHHLLRSMCKYIWTYVFPKDLIVFYQKLQCCPVLIRLPYLILCLPNSTVRYFFKTKVHKNLYPNMKIRHAHCNVIKNLLSFTRYVFMTDRNEKLSILFQLWNCKSNFLDKCLNCLTKPTIDI